VEKRPFIIGVAALLIAAARPATAQQPAVAPDTARAQIRAVLRAFYLNYESRNWDALAAYVLSPKLLERRGGSADLERVAKGRSRTRRSSQAAAAPPTCPSSGSPMIDDAIIRLQEDWAEVSVPRCHGEVPGVDELRLLYFEERWRFIYTDLFQAPPPSVAAEGPGVDDGQEHGR
jgi:hypothetical protein